MDFLIIQLKRFFQDWIEVKKTDRICQTLF